MTSLWRVERSPLLAAKLLNVFFFSSINLTSLLNLKVNIEGVRKAVNNFFNHNFLTRGQPKFSRGAADPEGLKRTRRKSRTPSELNKLYCPSITSPVSVNSRTGSSKTLLKMLSTPLAIDFTFIAV